MIATASQASAQISPRTLHRIQREAFFHSAARTAWRYIEGNTNARTGLVRATPGYDNATTWDIGSALGAIHSAWRLQLIDDAEHRARMGRLLDTIERLPLYDGAAYHKVYSVSDGSMVDGQGRRSRQGYAWSATDLGRLLVWLAIIERNDTVHAAAAARAAGRMNYERIVRDGYMWGEDGNRRRPGFQEGRVGYEQYAAAGFELWGHPPERALDPLLHTRPVEVWGQTILEDERGHDRVTSEPFVMMGLELGLEGPLLRMAEAVLALQRIRYERTDTVTIASEDAVDVPPYYFYYYCVYCNGTPFIVDIHTPGHELDSPRWVSTKATFGWHALLPDAYTDLAVRTVAPARTGDGWQSGVFEGSARPTGTHDVNTAALILESALYVIGGGPLLGGEAR